jgi:hypothetical protein
MLSNKKQRRGAALICGVMATVLLACQLVLLWEPLRAQGTVTGAWKVIERTDKEGTVSSAIQPGIFLFLKNHYSIVQVMGSAPRPPQPANPNAATGAEIMAVYGQSFEAQTGTYRMVGSALELTPTVSKNPAVMTPPRLLRYEWKLSGERLVLTGPTPGIPRTYVLSRLE